MYLLKLQDPSDDPFDDPFLDEFFLPQVLSLYFHGVLPGMHCWVTFEASHELKSVTSGYLSDDELPQHSFIALVMQYTASEITTKLETFGSGVGLPYKTTCSSEGC